MMGVLLGSTVSVVRATLTEGVKVLLALAMRLQVRLKNMWCTD